jgi:hypothetical protein
MYVNCTHKFPDSLGPVKKSSAMKPVYVHMHVTAKSYNDFFAPPPPQIPRGHDVIRNLRDARTAAKCINKYGKAEHVMRCFATER